MKEENREEKGEKKEREEEIEEGENREGEKEREEEKKKEKEKEGEEQKERKEEKKKEREKEIEEGEKREGEKEGEENREREERKEKKKEEQRKNWEGKQYAYFAHTACEYFPCHAGGSVDDFNCLFCYCPLYVLGRSCGGNFRYTKDGIKDCTACLLPHKRKNYGYVIGKYREIVEHMKKET